jgi:hypothetical protein
MPFVSCICIDCRYNINKRCIANELIIMQLDKEEIPFCSTILTKKENEVI